MVRIYPYLPLCRVWWLWSPLNKLWSGYGHENLATWHSNVEDYSSTNKFGNVFKRFPKLRLEKQIRNGFLNKPCLQRVKGNPNLSTAICRNFTISPYLSANREVKVVGFLRVDLVCWTFLRKINKSELNWRWKTPFPLVVCFLQLLESSLQQELPPELLAALSDGVVLCNLVNHLRPNTISVIYAPPHRGRAGVEGAPKVG